MTNPIPVWTIDNFQPSECIPVSRTNRSGAYTTDHIAWLRRDHPVVPDKDGYIPSAHRTDHLLLQASSYGHLADPDAFKDIVGIVVEALNASERVASLTASVEARGARTKDENPTWPNPEGRPRLISGQYDPERPVEPQLGERPGPFRPERD